MALVPDFLGQVPPRAPRVSSSSRAGSSRREEVRTAAASARTQRPLRPATPRPALTGAHSHPGRSLARHRHRRQRRQVGGRRSCGRCCRRCRRHRPLLGPRRGPNPRYACAVHRTCTAHAHASFAYLTLLNYTLTSSHRTNSAYILSLARALPFATFPQAFRLPQRRRSALVSAAALRTCTSHRPLVPTQVTSSLRSSPPAVAA